MNISPQYENYYFYVYNLNKDSYFYISPGEARTRDLGITSNYSWCRLKLLSYKNHALTNCATGDISIHQFISIATERKRKDSDFPHLAC